MKKLVAYITSGYPDKAFSIDLAMTFREKGVDTLELGIPFSDPVADGPLIEKANYKALKKGFKFKDLLDISKEIAPNIDTLWMGYFNSFYQHDLNTLVLRARELHVNGFVIPDLPYEEAKAYKKLFETNCISNISFVAPTDTEERIRQIVKESEKFIYLVAYAGITGSAASEDLAPTVEAIKSNTDTPIYVGFGVNQNTAKDKARGVDGVIVGSAFVDVLLREDISHTQKINICGDIAQTIKEKIND